MAALAVAAYGKENVVGVLMPDGIQPDIDSNGLVEFLGIHHYVFNIQGGTGGILDDGAFGHEPQPSDHGEPTLPDAMVTLVRHRPERRREARAEHL